jgi:hypothetical protein
MKTEFGNNVARDVIVADGNVERRVAWRAFGRP